MGPAQSCRPTSLHCPFLGGETASDGPSVSSLLRVDPGSLALWASISTLLLTHALGRRQLNSCVQWHRPPTAMCFTLVHENKKPNSSFSFSRRKLVNKTQPLPGDTGSQSWSPSLLPGLCYQRLLGRGPALGTIILWCSVGSHPSVPPWLSRQPSGTCPVSLLWLSQCPGIMASL